MTAIKKGNERAFVSAYDQLHARIFHYFLKKTGSRDTARELTQQVFIKLWQGRQGLSEAHSVDAHCFTISNSVLVDHLRKQALERRLKENILHEEKEMAVHNEFESADYLDKAAGYLPPERKNIFLLKLAKGYSNKEIAEQLSISVKTVEDHYSKAIRQLRSVQLAAPVIVCLAASAL